MNRSMQHNTLHSTFPTALLRFLSPSSSKQASAQASERVFSLLPKSSSSHNVLIYSSIQQTTLTNKLHTPVLGNVQAGTITEKDQQSIYQSHHNANLEWKIYPKDIHSPAHAKPLFEHFITTSILLFTFLLFQTTYTFLFPFTTACVVLVSWALVCMILFPVSPFYIVCSCVSSALLLVFSF